MDESNPQDASLPPPAGGGASSSDHASRKKKKDNENDGRKRKNTSKATDDDMTPKNKKRALKQERQSHRKHYDEVSRAKALWNRMRVKANDKEDVREMMDELMELLSGRLHEVSMQHDASRVAQAAIQFGTPEQRAAILNELAPAIVELSKVQYAHFVVLKLIAYCCTSRKEDEANRRVFVRALKGHIPKLAVHSVAARVVEVVFSQLPNKSSAPLRQELYGPHYALFMSEDGTSSSPPPRGLKSVLEKHPDKKDPTLKYVRSVLDRGTEKGLFGFAFFQELFGEYADCCTPNELRGIAPNLVDHSIHMLSTRAGTHVVALCASYGTAKDRKRIMKSLKGYTRSSLLHRDAYIAILRLVDVTDDTVTVQKLLLSEITVKPPAAADADADADVAEEGEERPSSPLLDLALSDTASKLFLLVLAPSNTAYFDPSELELLRRPATVISDKGGETVTVATSKKDPEVRREEILHYLRKSLCDLCIWHAPLLMRNKNGARVLHEVYRSFPSEELASAIVDATTASPPSGNNRGTAPSDGEELSIFEHPVGHLFVKNLLLDEVKRKGDSLKPTKRASSKADVAPRHANQGGVSFAKHLHSRHEGKLFDIASSNRGAFVLTALASVDALELEVKRELGNKMAKIEALAKKQKGFVALLAALQ